MFNACDRLYPVDKSRANEYGQSFGDTDNKKKNEDNKKKNEDNEKKDEDNKKKN